MRAKKIVINIVKAVVFVALVVASCAFLAQLFKPEDNRTKISAGGFRLEEENSLDVVFVGSSTLYRYISPNLLWEEQGFTSYVYGGPGAPFDVIDDICEEVYKTQTPDLIVVDARRLIKQCEYKLDGKEIYTDEAKSRYSVLVNNFPFGINKIKAIMETPYIPMDEKLLYITEIGKYHSRWGKVLKLILTGEYDFNYEFYGEKYDLKGYAINATIYDGTDDYEELSDYVPTAKELPEDLVEQLNKLLTYAKDKNIELLFLDTPYVGAHKSVMDVSKSIQDIVEANGFKYLEMNYEVGELGLNTVEHYYDINHTNAWGSRIVTSRVGQYIMDNYDINTTHSKSVEEEWTKTARIYEEKYERADALLTEYLAAYQIENEDERKAKLKEMLDASKKFAKEENPSSKNQD